MLIMQIISPKICGLEFRRENIMRDRIIAVKFNVILYHYNYYTVQYHIDIIVYLDVFGRSCRVWHQIKFK